jgi:hypothetical protein
MLPKSISTERGRQLQAILSASPPEVLVQWPMPTKDDYVLIGAIIVLYSYIDLNLRRILEVVDLAGVLPPPWKGTTANLTIADVQKAIQSLPDWSESNLYALRQIEEFRGIRNLLAHFAIRRFPEDDAFVFVTKSARDYKREFGADPQPGAVMTGVAEVGQIREIIKVVEKLVTWLSQATAQIEDQYFRLRD